MLWLLFNMPLQKVMTTIVDLENTHSNCISFLYQDDTRGLEVNKGGKWIPINPNEGTLVVNIGDVIRVTLCITFGYHLV